MSVEAMVAVVKIWGEETAAFVEMLDDIPLDVLVGVEVLDRLGYVVDPKAGRLEKVGLLLVCSSSL